MLVNILIYLLIFVVKVFEVTLATTRIVLITKGEKLKGAIIGFFEVIIWIILISTVLADVTSDPFKVLIYSLGFAVGNYVGTIFEQKLGFGTVRLETIVKEEDGIKLTKELRDNGFAVTVVLGEGMHYKRHVLIMHIKRKRTEKAIQLIRNLQPDVVITVNEVKPVYGGYGLFKK
ncbi:uncharacterized protein YebE (UPF0316 family) [Natranaerovirga pectinivora]|uniref:UPF0316 protein EDC18_103157 n=1 Tax=Natranaerovirga pectinivora TaxID=682400 RepID=A0A4R3ML87_9FIRM|nr:DUF5698 domain-containing protein [Natranaerovirga pectinivora]TCT15452.1 uncharacterized protein YebE (UPF0316 family) [Natranaerovirga pectinivora]